MSTLTLIDQSDTLALPLAALVELRQQLLRVRPRDRQAGDGRDVGPLRARSVLVRRVARCGWVAWVNAEELDRTTLDGGRVASRAIGIAR